MAERDRKLNVANIDLDYSCLIAMMRFLLVSYDVRLLKVRDVDDACSHTEISPRSVYALR
jgi:hypothetical protein